VRERAVTSVELSSALTGVSIADREFCSRARRVHVSCQPHARAALVGLPTLSGLQVGAHLSAPRKGEDMKSSLVAQIAALREVTSLAHVRLDDALYSEAEIDADLLLMIVKHFVEIDPTTSLIAPHASPLAMCARAHRLTVIREAHADRRYRPDGLPLAMNEEGALLTAAEAVMQATLLARYGGVIAANGVLLPMEFDTLSIQSGDDGAVQRLQAIETAVGLRFADVPADAAASTV
jgi:lactam utilization protein B